MSYDVGDLVNVDGEDGCYHRAHVVGWEMVRCPVVKAVETKSPHRVQFETLTGEPYPEAEPMTVHPDYVWVRGGEN